MYLGSNEVATHMTSGLIFMWHGTTVPSGWVLCDGGNGTPNLVDKFVRASQPADIGVEGGTNDAVAVSHGHTFTGTPLTDHLHAGNYYATVTNGNPDGSSGTGSNYMKSQSTKDTDAVSAGTPTGGGLVATGVVGTNLNIPIYYSLAYIMKLNSGDMALGGTKVASVIPQGLIAPTALVTIPSGWFICDGNNGTPNLVDKFIRGCAIANVNTEGGTNDSVIIDHSHTFTWSAMPTHLHNNNYYSATPDGRPDSGGDTGGPFMKAPGDTIFTANAAEAPTGTCSTDGADGTGANQPPFYTLSYMMKGA